MKRLIFLLFLVFLIGCTQKSLEVKMTDAVLVIAQKDYQPKEFLDTKQELEKAGLTVSVASITKNIAIAANDSITKPDLAISEIRSENYRALVIIGGPGAQVLLKNKELFNLIKEFNSQNKIVAAICYSPVILAKVGILKDKKATVFPNNDLISELEKAGAEYIEEHVIQDENIITGNGPEAAAKFGKTIADALK